ncbi:MAG: hypothetical protein EPN50_01055 [Chloroflexota bacterium]|nr:MAG: hypothetical protein EPN50_01055 [Chloroflexota bacterium]
MTEGPVHVHEETRSAVEAMGHALHGDGRPPGAHGGGAEPGGEHAGEHWGGNGTDPLPTYAPLGPIDWTAWGVAAVSVAIAVVTAALFWLAAFGH